LRAHARRNTAVVEAACGALCSIASFSDALKQAAADSGAPRRIVTVMRARAGRVRVQKAACAALRNIATGSVARARFIVARGALPLVDAALKAHSGNVEFEVETARLAAQLRNASRPPAC
jgi:hypothetical protein